MYTIITLSLGSHEWYYKDWWQYGCMLAPMMLRAISRMPSYSAKFDSRTSMKMVVGIGRSVRLLQRQCRQDHIRRWLETDEVPGYPISMLIWHTDRWHGFNAGVQSYSTVNRKQLGCNTETQRQVAQHQEHLKLNCSVSMFIVVYQTWDRGECPTSM